MLLPKDQINNIKTLVEIFIDKEIQKTGMYSYEQIVASRNWLSRFIAWLKITESTDKFKSIKENYDENKIEEEKYAFKVSNALNGYILKEYSEDHPMVFEDEEIADESHIDQAVLKLIQYLSYEYLDRKSVV